MSNCSSSKALSFSQHCLCFFSLPCFFTFYENDLEIMTNPLELSILVFSVILYQFKLIFKNMQISHCAHSPLFFFVNRRFLATLENTWKLTWIYCSTSSYIPYHSRNHCNSTIFYKSHVSYQNRNMILLPQEKINRLYS